MKTKIIILVVLVFIAAGGIWKFSQRPDTTASGEARQTVRLAMDSQATVSLLAMVADAKTLWSEQGLKPEVQRVTTGRDAAQALLGGKVDVATMADFPFMLAAHQNEDLRIFATIAQSSLHIQVLADSRLGVKGATDLKGRKVGVTVGSAGQYHLERLLNEAGLTGKDCELLSMSPPELVAAAARRELAAICTWQPHIEKIRAIWGADALPIQPQVPYVMTFNLAAKNAYLQEHRDAVTRLCGALQQAEKLATRSPTEAQTILAQVTGIEATVIAGTWSDYEFRVTLPAALSGTLAEQAKWAHDAGLLKDGAAVADWKAKIATGFALEK